MNWLKKIFGDSSKKNWYYAATTDRAIRQVVISFPPTAITETAFSTIILPADKYPVLAMGAWCAGFCRINDQTVMMLRAGKYADAVKAAGMTMALSFCHMPTHAILWMSARIETPELADRVHREYPHVPPFSKPTAEWVSGLSPHDRELVPAVLATDPLRVVLAEDSPSRNHVYLPNGQVQECALPYAVGEFQIHLDNDAKKMLNEQWGALLKHDASIPNQRRNFQRATNVDLVKLMPLDKDPILAR